MKRIIVILSILFLTACSNISERQKVLLPQEEDDFGPVPDIEILVDAYDSFDEMLNAGKDFIYGKVTNINRISETTNSVKFQVIKTTMKSLKPGDSADVSIFIGLLDFEVDKEYLIQVRRFEPNNTIIMGGADQVFFPLNERGFRIHKSFKRSFEKNHPSLMSYSNDKTSEFFVSKEDFIDIIFLAKKQ